MKPTENDSLVVERLVSIETKLDAVLTRDEDHERRIRTLEARRTVSPGQLWGAFASLIACAVGLSVLARFVIEVVVR